MHREIQERRKRKRQRNHHHGVPIATTRPNKIRIGFLLHVLLSLSFSLPESIVAFAFSFNQKSFSYCGALKIRPGHDRGTCLQSASGDDSTPASNNNKKNKDNNELKDVDPKKQAISALSQPVSKSDEALNNDSPSDESSSTNNFKNEASLLPPPIMKPQRFSNRPSKKTAKTTMHSNKKHLHKKKDQAVLPHARPRNDRPGAGNAASTTTRDRYVSMLPPPLQDPNKYGNENDENNDDSSRFSSSDQAVLSSWEQFLGAKRRPESEGTHSSSSLPSPMQSNTGSDNRNEDDDDLLSEQSPSMAKLPSIHDLFPPDLSTSRRNNSKKREESDSTAKSDGTKKSNSRSQRGQQQRQRDRGSKKSNFVDSTTLFENLSSSSSQHGKQPSSEARNAESESQINETNVLQQSQQSPLEGVLPVSDLFYRSAQSIDLGGDDEELPFSAEQSDQLAVDNNKVKIRRNQASVTPSEKKITAKSSSSSKIPGSTASEKKEKTPNGRRRMVRRGMEMLVGGVPINADPPQRNIEMWYDTRQPWYAAISVNTKDFGPFFHSDSQHLLTRTELGLFCEFFVHYTMKWGVCPRELRSIAQQYLEEDHAAVEQNDVPMDALLSNASPMKSSTRESVGEGKLTLSPDYDDPNLLDMEARMEEVATSGIFDLDAFKAELLDAAADGKSMKSAHQSAILGVEAGPEIFKGFGKPARSKSRGNKKSKGTDRAAEVLISHLVLHFTLGVTQTEVEDGENAWKDVLRRGIMSCVNKELQHSSIIAKNDANKIELRIQEVAVAIKELKETDDGLTSITSEATIFCEPQNYKGGDAEKHLLRITNALERAVDDGDLRVALAAAARNEERWSPELRERIYEEFLFEEEAEDNVLLENESGEEERIASTAGSTVPERSAESMFGSSSGITWDYFQGNAANAPFQGKLGPRLLEAMEARANENPPKVIAVGDVHGCVDELQDLLKECEYYPGDLIVFLGDLVSKGPDSISVVQMSREIGAMGIRGNHDFEVIRWHQAIKSGECVVCFHFLLMILRMYFRCNVSILLSVCSFVSHISQGVDPPVVGSEHYYVASCLSKADIQWLYSLPWYIASKDLSALFVHAGFVSGIRLQKQNPRLMMNMRSILPDGTVTSKFFNNWPWARLWDGPQTVYFGHDADRGLQQYEHAIGLDTGCVYGGRLTACILPEKRLVSVSARREYFKYRRKHYD